MVLLKELHVDMTIWKGIAFALFLLIRIRRSRVESDTLSDIYENYIL